MDKQQDPTFSTENLGWPEKSEFSVTGKSEQTFWPTQYIYYPMINYNEKNLKKSIYMYNWVTFLYRRN